MELVLYFLALTGVATCLQGPLHYEYKYFGSVFSGIPELNNQVAGWAMKSNVHIYVTKNDGVAIIELKNFKMAQYNDLLGCDVRGEIPEEKYTKIPNEKMAAAVESPFKVNLFGAEDYAIEYEEEPYNWLINMRKGLASIFKNQILRANTDTQIEEAVTAALHDGNVINVFSLQEDTVLGRCKSDYSIHPIPEYLSGTQNQKLKQHIEHDVQSDEPESSSYTSKTSKKTSSKTSRKTTSKSSRKSAGKYRRPNVPELENQLWHVVRSIDFDNCEDKVAMQATPLGFDKDVNTQQYQWARSRSSVTEYIFRGSAGNFRLEKAIVEGAVTAAPMGIKSENLQSRVNMTLQLANIHSLDSGSIPSLGPKVEHSKTFMYEVRLGINQPSLTNQHPWVKYNEGEEYFMRHFEMLGADNFTPEEIAIMKDQIIQNVKKVSLHLTDFDQETEHKFYTGEVAVLMNEVAHTFKSLKKKDIIKIFDHFFENDLLQSDILAKKFIIDAAAASGEHFAIEALFDYIKHGKVSSVQIMTIFMSLSGNLGSPGNIPTIMDYVLSLNLREAPFLTSTVLINFSELLHRICTRPNAETINISGEVTGKLCDKVLIKNRYIPHLKNKIHGENSDWEKDVAIRALSTLGTPFAFSILAPVIEGQIKCNPRTRSLAIYGLQSWRLYQDKIIRTQIVDLLTDIYTNIGEDPEVREAALGTIVSWSPEPSFWFHLARISWREPSKQFATFMSSLIEGFANAEHSFYKTQNQAAYHAQRLAKPVAPSMKYSHVKMMSARLAERQIEKFEILTTHSSRSGFDIKEVYHFLITNLGGFQMTNVEFSLLTEGLANVLKNLAKNTRPDANNEGITVRVAKDILERIQETVKAQNIKSKMEPKADVFMRFLELRNLYLPLNKETLNTLPFSDPTNIGSLIVQLGLGYDLVLANYMIPIDLKSFHVTELGLPAFVTQQTSIVRSDTSLTSLKLGSAGFSYDSLKKIQLNSEVLVRISSMSATLISVFFPWTTSAAMTGVSSVRDITLPLNMVLKYSQDSEGGKQNILEMALKSLYNKKYSVLKAANMPFTSIIPLRPQKQPTKMDFKLIYNKAPKKTKIHLPNTYAGLEADFTWNSEIECSSLAWTLSSYLSDPEKLAATPLLLYTLSSPTVKFWDINLEFDPTASKTKLINFKFLSGIFGKAESDEFTQETGFTQESDYDYGQESVGQFGQESVGQFGQESVDQFGQFGQNSFDDSQGFEEEFGSGNEVETFNNNKISYGDTLKQRSEKIQQHFGGSAMTASMKIDFVGNVNRSYEFSYSFSKSQISGERKVRKAQISFLRSPVPGVDENPASLCLDVQRSFPAYSKLDDISHLLSQNLDKDIKAEVTLGCSGKPIISVKGLYHISDKWKEIMRAELPNSCDYDSYNPLHIFHTHALYDDIKVSVTWKKVPELKRFPITNRVINCIEKMIHFHSSENECHDKNEEHQIKIKIHRCPIRGTWFVDVEGQNLKQSIESIPHNEIFNFAFSASKRNIHVHDERTSLFNEESDTCSVGVDAVRTFDGFTYDYNPTQCWTVAAKDCQIENGKMLLVRSPEGENTIPDAKYIDVKLGLVIEYTKNVLKVNGKVVDPIGDEEIIKDESGKVLVVIQKKNDYYMARFSKKFYIIIKDTIKVHVPDLMSGLTCGLCGNFDGEPEAELVGPKRCVYENPSLFASSWTAGSDTCDIYTLLGLREKAEKYQKTCSVIDDLYEKCPKFNHRGVKFGWLVRTINNLLCVSSTPSPHCEYDCALQESDKKMVKFGCWPEEAAPLELKNAISNNLEYIDTPVNEIPYIKEKYQYMLVATTCKYY